MKNTFKVKFEVSYTWNCDSGIDIPDKHKPALIEDAEERIFKMQSEGFSCGELSTSVRYGKDIVPEEDEENGLTYSGSWNINLL